MPSPPRRGLTSDRRRALRLLAGALGEGCTEVIMLAHGFSIDLMVELINAGLATAKAERMVASGKSIKATRVRITEAGRVALAEAGRAKKSSSPLIHRSGAFIGEEAGDRGFS